MKVLLEMLVAGCAHPACLGCRDCTWLTVLIWWPALPWWSA